MQAFLSRLLLMLGSFVIMCVPLSHALAFLLPVQTTVLTQM